MFVHACEMRRLYTIMQKATHTHIHSLNLPYNTIICLQGGDATVVVSDLGHPKGLALDWVGRNLYFTDSLRSQIGVSSLDGKHRGVLLWKNMYTPQSLVIHQESK